jgi:hypothetical protein
MKKDITFHVAEDVYVVAMKEWDKDFLSQNWNIYFINTKSNPLDTVLVVSRGNSSSNKTSTLRHNLGTVKANTMKKIELITDDVLSFTNEYLVTFFLDGKLYDRQFTFIPHSISEKNLVVFKSLDIEAIVAK